jgi:TRAP-type transport system small permease protein
MSTAISGFSRLVRAIDRACQSVVACLVVIMVAVVFAQVVFRYAVVRPIYWGDELSRYLFVWISFVGAAVAMGGRIHYGFDYLTEKCPPAVRRAISLLMTLLAVGFFMTCLVYGWESIRVVSVQRSPSLQIPMGWVYAALPVGSALMLLHLIEQALVQPKQNTPALGFE